MHAASRRPVASWPAALLPGAMLLALLTTGAATAAGNSSAAEAPAPPPVTELHVVEAGE